MVLTIPLILLTYFGLFNTLQNQVVQRWLNNEEVLLLGLKCLTQLTLIEKPSTLGHQNFIEFLLNLVTEKYNKIDEGMTIISELKLLSLRVISNFQPCIYNFLGTIEYQYQIKKYCLGILHNFAYLTNDFKDYLLEYGLLYYMKVELSVYNQSSQGLNKEELTLLQIIISLLGHLSNRNPTISDLIGEMKFIPLILSFFAFQNNDIKSKHLELYQCIVQSLKYLCQIEANKVLKLIKVVHLSGHDKLIPSMLFGDLSIQSILENLTKMELDERLTGIVIKTQNIVKKEVLQLLNSPQDQIDKTRVLQLKDGQKQYQEKLKILKGEFERTMNEYIGGEVQKKKVKQLDQIAKLAEISFEIIKQNYSNNAKKRLKSLNFQKFALQPQRGSDANEKSKEVLETSKELTINIKTPKRAQSAYKLRPKIRVFNPIMTRNKNESSLNKNDLSNRSNNLNITQQVSSSKNINNNYSIVNRINYASMQLDYENFQKTGLADSKNYFNFKRDTDKLNDLSQSPGRNLISNKNSHHEIYTVNYQAPDQQFEKPTIINQTQKTKISNLRQLISKPKSSIAPIQEERLSSPKQKNNKQIIEQRQQPELQHLTSFNALQSQPINIKLIRPHTSQGRTSKLIMSNLNKTATRIRNEDLDGSVQKDQRHQNNYSSILSLKPKSQVQRFNQHDSMMMLGSNYSNYIETPQNLNSISLLGANLDGISENQYQQSLEYKLSKLPALPSIPFDKIKENDLIIIQKYLDVELNDKIMNQESYQNVNLQRNIQLVF
eukprot:403333229